jgi:1-acyl-sn-glycerol-3-phosphate acyltransferase
LILCIFPEGERSIDGTLRPFRKGPAILATELRVPVVPVAIEGTYEVWRRGSSEVRLHPVKIRFGKPLVPTSDKESSDAFNQRLLDAVEQLLEATAADEEVAPSG